MNYTIPIRRLLALRPQVSQPTTTQLPDGAIRVCVGSRCGTVSSWHLVPGKVAQLEQLEQQERKP